MNHSITFEVPKIPESPKLRAIVEQSARNLVSLFADHEDGINRAMVEGEGDKTTLSHSIVLDLGRNKQIDKLSYAIKGGDEITQAIPNPDEPDLFRKEPPLSGMRTKTETAPVVAVPVPVAPLGLPAPIEHLPGPRGKAEERAYQEGREAFARGETLDQTPYRARSAGVKKLRELWIEGWSDLKKESEESALGLWFDEGRDAYADGKLPTECPYDKEGERLAYERWQAGWMEADQEEGDGREDDDAGEDLDIHLRQDGDDNLV